MFFVFDVKDFDVDGVVVWIGVWFFGMDVYCVYGIVC